MTMTFRDEILEVANGEPIEAIVVGLFGDSEWRDKDAARAIPEEDQDKVWQWDEISDKLNYEYDRGFGGADCHAIVAWTKNRVLYVDEYDGSTRVCWYPRYPVDCHPNMSGMA